MTQKAFVIDKNIHETTLIAIAEQCASEILVYLHKDNVNTEWKLIRDLLKQGLRNREKYCKCDVTSSANNMFEMRFRNMGKNDRIYCQEMSMSGRRIIIMCELFEGKKTQDIPKVIKKRIDTLSKNSYEIIK